VSKALAPKAPSLVNSQSKISPRRSSTTASERKLQKKVIESTRGGLVRGDMMAPGRSGTAEKPDRAGGKGDTSAPNSKERNSDVLTTRAWGMGVPSQDEQSAGDLFGHPEGNHNRCATARNGKKPGLRNRAEDLERLRDRRQSLVSQTKKGPNEFPQFRSINGTAASSERSSSAPKGSKRLARPLR